MAGTVKRDLCMRFLLLPVEAFCLESPANGTRHCREKFLLCQARRLAPDVFSCSRATLRCPTMIRKTVEMEEIEAREN
jgi:hypothetical protein